MEKKPDPETRLEISSSEDQTAWVVEITSDQPLDFNSVIMELECYIHDMSSEIANLQSGNALIH
jgi:hypothetical protein